MPGEIGRRDLIRLTAGAAIAAKARAAGEHRFFTPEEYALVEQLTELIIPADDHSGGARAAGVAAYIDARLAEAFDPAERDGWRTGLARVNTLSTEMHGAGFLQCTAAQRTTVLERLAGGDAFFRELKSLTVFGYYTSKIGIHDDLGYLGNSYQQGDYAGELPGPAEH
jgi:hypothetical protein